MPFIDIREGLYTFCGTDHDFNIVIEGLDVCKMILPLQGINVILFLLFNSIFASLLIKAEVLTYNSDKKWLPERVVIVLTYFGKKFASLLIGDFE